MFGSEVLEVALGVTLLFLLASLICSAASEAIEGVIQNRGRFLERAVRELLQIDDSAALQAFYGNPLMSGLFRGRYAARPREAWWSFLKAWRSWPNWWRRRNLPSYIPAGTFASTVVDLVLRGDPKALAPGAPGDLDPGASAVGEVDAGESMVQRLRRAADAYGNPAIRAAVLQACDVAGEDLEKAKQDLAAWYNGAMDRVSGWYKRRTQLILFLLGLGSAIALNLDVITITRRLGEDQALRSAVVASASAAQAQYPASAGGLAERSGETDPAERVQQLRAGMQAIGYPMGWRDGVPAPQMESLCGRPHPCFPWKMSPWAVLQVALGWLILALAVMLGAPFWFDVLNKIMVIRSTVKPTEKSPNEGSEDRRKT